MSFSRRYITETFVDLYPVASMRGVYLASQLSAGKPGTRKIFTKISYDKGRAWSDVTVPERHANGSVITCASTVRPCTVTKPPNFLTKQISVFYTIDTFLHVI